LGLWTTEKVTKKEKPNFPFVVHFSLLIGHLVMAYLVGYRSGQRDRVSQPPSKELWLDLFGLVAFSGIFMFVFSLVSASKPA